MINKYNIRIARWGLLTGVILLLTAVNTRMLRAMEPEDIKGVFVATCKTDGEWNLWKFNADGSLRKQLTDNEYDVSDPTWCPEGERIVFSMTVDGVPFLYAIKRDGTEKERLWEGSQGSFCPDGSAIVFRREGQIYLRKLDSGEERMLTPGDWLRCTFPRISPDGESFAVASRHKREIGLYVGNIDADSPEPNELPTRTEACTPQWRPDGEKILYQSSSHVYEIDPDTGEVRQLTFGADVQNMPAYNPDGTKIVFTRAPDGGGPWSLHVKDLENEEELELETPGESCMYPDWKLE